MREGGEWEREGEREGEGKGEGEEKGEGGRTDCTRRVEPSVGGGLGVLVSSFPCPHLSVASPASLSHHLPCVCVCVLSCEVCVCVCARVWIYIYGLVSEIILVFFALEKGGRRERERERGRERAREEKDRL